jgi:hypothetical protein
MVHTCGNDAMVPKRYKFRVLHMNKSDRRNCSMAVCAGFFITNT